MNQFLKVRLRLAAALEKIDKIKGYKIMQIPLFKPQTEWLPPENFPDLSKYDEIAIDLETKDPDLMKMGSGSVVGKGDVVGIAVAVASITCCW